MKSGHTTQEKEKDKTFKIIDFNELPEGSTMVGILLNEGNDDIKLYVQSAHAEKLRLQFTMNGSDTFEKTITKELEQE